MRALVKASRDFAAKPELWVDAMVTARPDVDRATLEELARTFVGAWSVNGGLNRDEIEATVDWTYATPDFAGLRRWRSTSGSISGSSARCCRARASRPSPTSPASDRRERRTCRAGARSVPARRAGDRAPRRLQDLPARRRRRAGRGAGQVSLEIGRDSFVSLVGPSGCGKTTLLRLINGLLPPDAGEVLVDGAAPRAGAAHRLRLPVVPADPLGDGGGQRRLRARGERLPRGRPPRADRALSRRWSA